MKNIITIMLRDIRSAFFSPLAYGVLSLFVCISGYFFFNLLGSFNFAVAQEARLPVGELSSNLNLNEWVVQGYFQTVLLLLILVVPLITMRTFADERQYGTYMLMQSLPLSSIELYTGKFLGSLLLVYAMLTICFSLPLGLCIVSEPELLPILTGMLGLFFAASAFVALGVAVASIGKNSLLSGILTLGLLLILYGAHVPAESLDEAGQALLRYVSPLWQLRELFRGVLTVAPFVYFSTIIFLAASLGSICMYSESRGRV